MTQPANPPATSPTARGLCQTAELEAALAALDRGDTVAAKQQLQAALARNQRLARQLDSTTPEAALGDRPAAGIAQLDADGRFEAARAQQCREIATALPTAIFQTDLQGTWTFLNPAWTDLCGYSPEESFGSSAFHFLKPVGRESGTWEAFQDLLAGRRESLHCEVRCRSKQSRARRLDLAAKRLYGPDGEAIGTVGTLTDPTERGQDADRLHAVADTVPGLVSWVSRDGNYLGVNQRLADALRRDPTEFVGKSVGFLSGNQAFRNFSQAFLASDAAHTSEVLETEVNGVSHRYSIAGQKYQQGNAAVFVGIDITQSQQAERALRESEARFRQLAENIEQVFWLLDLADKKTIYVSPAYNRTWGRPLATAYQPEAWLDTVHPEDRSRVLDARLRQIRGEYDLEYRILHPDGKVRWIRDRAFPIRDARGRVYRLAGIAEDISERKQVEETLKASLEEKELLLKEVHHRVKNNLQVISSLFNLSAHTINDPDALAVLAESQNRIASMALIHGKLYQSKNLANIDFAEYIRDLIEHLLASYNADPERIQTELHIEAIALDLDAAIPCGLLFNELISNALKHAFPQRRHGQLQIRFANAPGENLILRVADNGTGLPAGFDPSQYSTLGLSLIVALTQQLRGTLKMYNGPGAIFEVTFPQPVERKRF